MDAVTHELHTPLASLRLYLDTLRGRRAARGAARRVPRDHGRGPRAAAAHDRPDHARGAHRSCGARGASSSTSRGCSASAPPTRASASACPPDAILVEVPGGARVRGDVEQLRVAFRNLIDNAIRYAGGEVHVEVRVRAVSARRLEIEFADLGVGIPASALDRVFQRFQRLPQEAVRTVRGLGPRAVHRAQRRARARRQRARRERGRGQGQPLHPDAPRTCRLNARILLVEDEEHLARGLAFNLEAEGYRGRGDRARRGRARAARRRERAPPVDLVLLDVMLPGISGFDVVREAARGGEPRPGAAAHRARRRRATSCAGSTSAPTTT